MRCAFKKPLKGPESCLSLYELSMLLQKTWVQPPAPMLGLTIICHSSSRRFGTFSPLQAPGTQVIHTWICRQNSHIHTNINLKIIIQNDEDPR